MNQTTILKVVERLERLLSKLPEKIRRPVSRELTPLKELFLQQRPPRFLFVGSSKLPTQQIINALFAPDAPDQTNVALMPVHRWTDWDISGHGTISICDAREAAGAAADQIEVDLNRQPADIVFVFEGGESNSEAPSAGVLANSLLPFTHNLADALGTAKIVGVCFGSRDRSAQLEERLSQQPAIRSRLLTVVQFAE